MSVRQWCLAFCLVAGWAVLCQASWAQDAELVADEASGIVPITGERRVVIRGFTGDVRIRAGSEREVRFRSTRLGDQNKEIPIGVWISGNEIRLIPTVGTEDLPRELQIVVPKDLATALLDARGVVTASGLGAGFELAGAVVDADLRGLSGSIQIGTLGGRAHLQEIDGDVHLRVKNCAASVISIRGSVLLNVDDSTIEVRKVSGSVEGEIRGTQWKLDEVGAPVLLRLTGGRGEGRAFAQGGELRLSATPMLLRESKGDTDIDTDAEFRFEQTQADLHINSYGAAVFGRANQGILEVRTDGSSVEVDQNTGPVRVEGQGLKLKLIHIAGELFVNAKSSELDIDDTTGEVTILSENTTVVVRNASHSVEIDSRGGDVEVRDLRGSLDLDADSERVVVSWATLIPTKDSSVKNSGGSVEMSFPANSGARVEAESKFGSVESDLAGLEVNEAGSQAKGALSQATNRPTVRIVADRDIVLTGAVAAEP